MKKINFSLPKIRHGVNHPLSFSLHLTLNFIFSTFVPFILITFLMVRLFTQQQISDILQTTRSHLSSLSQNVSMYLSELEQATLMPYYDENFSLYLSQSNTEQQLSYLEKQRIRQSLGNMIDFIRVTRSDLQNILIVNGNNCLFYSTSLFNAVPLQDYTYEMEPWYQEAVSSDGNVLLLSIHTPSYFGNQGQPVFSLVRSLVNLRTRVPYAVIKVDVPSDVFDSFLRDVDFYVDSTLLLLDKNQNLIYTDYDGTLQINTANAETSGTHSENAEVNGRKMILETMEIQPYGWELQVYIDQASILSRQNTIYIIAFSLYTFGVIFALLSYLGISRSMVRSIHSISECLNAFKAGNFKKQYRSASKDELAFLGEAVNDMGQQMEQLIQREYVNTLQRKEAEMRALQSQIRPHFLFNTIGSLVALNQLGLAKELEEALFSLSSLLRYVLNSQPLVSLGEELEFCGNYFMLQKLRFDSKLTYSIQCPEEAVKFLIPRLLLQPYLENAILHGVEPCHHPCTVLIKVSMTEAGISILIQDDGIGFCSDAKAGIGMVNSKERLQNTYPDSSTTIHGVEGNGCSVNIEIKGDIL